MLGDVNNLYHIIQIYTILLHKIFETNLAEVEMGVEIWFERCGMSAVKFVGMLDDRVNNLWGVECVGKCLRGWHYTLRSKGVNRVPVGSCRVHCVAFGVLHST